MEINVLSVIQMKYVACLSVIALLAHSKYWQCDFSVLYHCIINLLQAIIDKIHSHFFLCTSIHATSDLGFSSFVLHSELVLDINISTSDLYE